ncbi:MAG: hypothetical protein AB7F86_03880 [Bdellovibrionales bacterium]
MSARDIIKDNKSIFVAISLSVLVIFIFQNCSGLAALSLRKQARDQALSSNHIFSAETYEAPSGTDEAYGHLQQEENPANNILTENIQLKLECSNHKDPWIHPLAYATGLKFKLVTFDAQNNLVAKCEFEVTNDDAMKNTMMMQKKIPMTLFRDHCQNLPYGKYHLVIDDTFANAAEREAHALTLMTGPFVYKSLIEEDPRFVTTFYTHSGLKNGIKYQDAIKKNKEGEDLEITHSADGWSTNERSQWVLADHNYAAQMGYLYNAESQCDAKLSPLMIKLKEGSTQGTVGLKLTDPNQGRLFDGLGRDATPAHSPVKVSWMTTADEFGFIALPDANGQVTGIDQLFGNHTEGPDGNTSLHGYEALGKWDGRPHPSSSLPGGLPDGVIDAQDPVFSALRIWIDQNLDAVAQTNELHPLSELKIQRIDLNIDARFYERDVYGNEIIYKTVAQREDSSLMVVFDLWWNFKAAN